MTLEICPAGVDELTDLLRPISHAFGFQVTEERLARARGVPEYELRFGAYDEGAVVGAVAAFDFEMTVPTSVSLRTSGLTMVGVLATHRRRGILRALLRSYLDDLRARGRVLSALLASEGAIYGRYGYGLASFSGDIEIERHRAVFEGLPAERVRARFVGEEDALRLCPPIWDRARASRPGMLSRSAAWWQVRRISDPEWQRAGRGPLQRVVIDVDGRPAAYALYRYTFAVDNGSLAGTLDVIEAVGDSPDATRAIWRYLFDVDVVHKIKAVFVPIDHPLLLLVPEARRLHMILGDTLWVRLIDVGAALSQRTYDEGGPLVLDVDDTFCPWNQGRYRLEGGVATRTDAPADLALDAGALGSVYLGGITFTALADAGRVTELSKGALRRADALFRGERAPWCPEIF